MTEQETIDLVSNMDIFEKSKVYKEYFFRHLWAKYESNYYREFEGSWGIKTYEEFVDTSNITKHNIEASDWKERGFASNSWITFTPASIYHYVYLNIKS
jgi:hypothetical protein